MELLLKILGVITGLFVLTGIIIYLLIPKQPASPENFETVADIDAYFEKITANQTPPGLNISVIKNGEIVYDKAFGYADIPLQKKTETDTIYPWWSTTKLFTAVAILQLEERGLLDIDDPLEKYLPYFNVEDEGGSPVTITIRQLLNHSSGLRDIMPDGVTWIRHPDEAPVNQTQFLKEKIIGKFRTVKYAPGSDEKYTNTSYIILGVIIEAITGVTYEEFVHKNILEPLDMKNTSFIRSDEHQKRATTGSWPVLDIFTILFRKYGEKDFFDTYIRETEKGRMWMNPVYTQYTPSTGLSGTSGDLAAFGQFLMTGTGLNGEQILSRTMLKEIQTIIPLNELSEVYKKNQRFSLGLKIWKVGNSRIYGHGGGGPGAGSLLAFIPDRDLVITIISNDTNTQRDPIIRALTSISWK